MLSQILTHSDTHIHTGEGVFYGDEEQHESQSFKIIL